LLQEAVSTLQLGAYLHKATLKRKEVAALVQVGGRLSGTPPFDQSGYILYMLGVSYREGCPETLTIGENRTRASPTVR
jgi:hypothetical protein